MDTDEHLYSNLCIGILLLEKDWFLQCYRKIISGTLVEKDLSASGNFHLRAEKATSLDEALPQQVQQQKLVGVVNLP